jgi:hypothetical protein
MLGRALASVHGLLRCDPERHVAVHGNPPPSRLVHNREVRLAGQILVDLDEVRAAVGERAYHCPSFCRRAHNDGVLRKRRIAVEAGAVGQEARADQLSLGQPTLDRGYQRERRVRRVVVHVANGGDAVGQDSGKCQSAFCTEWTCISHRPGMR